MVSCEGHLQKSFFFTLRYENDRDNFKQKVNMSLRACLNELHLPLADDPHAIRWVELIIFYTCTNVYGSVLTKCNLSIVAQIILAVKSHFSKFL